MAVSLERERLLWAAGSRVVAGVDEVGRGALAGPVSVGLVALAPCDVWPVGLADSKEIPAATRERLAVELAHVGEARAVGSASSREVDAFGIVGALRLAGYRALAEVGAAGVAVDAILLDGKHDWLTPPPEALFGTEGAAEDLAEVCRAALGSATVPPVTMVVGGDALCVSIAAASVLAKVARDAVMVEAHTLHPEFEWASNKGYGAEVHLDALRRLGPSPLHRVSWALPSRD